MYYTISHCDTHRPLGLGSKMDRAKALSIIRTRQRGDDGAPFAASEWYVTAWSHTDDGDDRIEFQVSADEFSACNGDSIF